MDMDGSISRKGVSSSSARELSAVPKPSHYGAGETDENMLTQDQMNSNLHNHKKQATKHFMSPTISAASKTSTREKNILGERNEADFSYSPVQKSHVAKPQYSHRSSSVISPQNCASKLNDDDQKSSFVADSSLNQYDPLTNYLSPRPKYLRYKPNRRREIFLHLKNMGGEGNDVLGVERSITTEPKADTGDDEGSMESDGDEILEKRGNNESPLPMQPKNDEILENEDCDDYNNEVVVDSEEDEEDEEEEEYVEDNGWSFNWFLKFLVLMVIVLLSPFLASLMENDVSSPTEPVMNGFDDIRVFPLDMNRSISSDYSQNKIEVSPTSIWELDQRKVGIEVADDIFSETRNEFVEVAVAVPEIWLDEVSDQELQKETMETEVVGDNEAEDLDQLHTFEPTKSEAHSVDEMEKDDFVLPKALDETEISERHDDIPNGDQNENYATLVQESDQMKDDYEVVLVEEEFVEDIYEDDKVTDYSKESSTSNSDVVVFMKSIYSKLQQIGLKPEALAIVSIFSLILAYAISIFSARNSHEHSKPVIEPPQQSTRTEKLTNVIPNVEMEPVEGKKNESIAKISSLFSPIEEASKDQRGEMDTKELPDACSAQASSLMRSMKDSAAEFSHTKTLEVELLGEFAVGEVSSSLRTCVGETRLNESENRSHSFSQFSGSRNHPLQPPCVFSEMETTSTSDSPYTDKKKLFKKEGSKDDGGEAKKKIINTTPTPTPVRRSSRIRNRAVMSP